MKLAVSNIAWEIHDDPGIFSILRESGVQGIEIAPTKIWPDWKGANSTSAQVYRKKLASEGFEVPALQAILFGKPELQLFAPEAKFALIEHIKYVCELGSAFGAKVLVFGAPKNRRRGQLSTNEAVNYATDLMQEIGEICSEFDVCIGLEHNPIEYGCDFITNAADARAFVDRVGSPGVQLHLDSGGLYMCGGDINETIKAVGPFIHYHISEPMLAPLAGGVIDHKASLETLNNINYDNWASIEMKSVDSSVLEHSIRCIVNDE